MKKILIYEIKNRKYKLTKKSDEELEGKYPTKKTRKNRSS
jgi:hypothetical protein